MKLTWNFDDHDVEIVLTFFNKWANDPFVRHREKRNIEPPRPKISKEHIWMSLVGCLLTSQQRAGPGRAVFRFLTTKPFPLSYAECSSKSDLESFAREILTSFGGIRRPPTISKQLASNHKKLESGLWQMLINSVEQLNSSDNPSLEREISHMCCAAFGFEVLRF